MNDKTKTDDAVEQANTKAAPVERLVSCDELREVCELTVKLIELRQNECKHLCIENIAPELFLKLLSSYSMHKSGLIAHPFADEDGANKIQY